jgi:hypothetical protein
MIAAVIIIATILLGVLLYIVWNLHRKVSRQEEIIEFQIEYLRKVSYTISESNMYVEQLDEKGTFRSDDEVGVFFNFMKEIQGSINQYRLPDNYGKAKK